MARRTLAFCGIVLFALIVAGAAWWVSRADDMSLAADGKDTALAAAESRMPPQMTFQPAFEPCAHCHEVGEGARTSSGPVLNGVIGRKAGTRDDYPYSQAMRDSRIVWTAENLRRFLTSPGAVVPGTRMAVGGFTEDQIDPLIEFLRRTPRS